MTNKLLYGIAAVVLVALLAVAGCSNPLTAGQGESGSAAQTVVESESQQELNHGPENPTDCIDPDDPAYSKVSDTQTVTWGNPRNGFSKTVEIVYYNTLTHFVIEVMSSNGVADVLMDDVSIKDFDGTVAPQAWQQIELPLEDGWQADGSWEFQLKVAGFGPPAYFDVEYDLLGRCVFYTLTLAASPEDGGILNGAGQYRPGAEVELAATATEGFTFINWTEDDGTVVSAEPVFTYTMPEMDQTLLAAFEAPNADYESPFIGTLRYVPGGTYQRDDNPGNTTSVSQFYIGVYEITQAQYTALTGTNPSYFLSPGDEAPVERVSWYDAIVFCNLLSMAEGKMPVYSIGGSTNPTDWGPVPRNIDDETWLSAVMDTDANGYRLPTEAEWMWAAMGADIENPGKVNTTGYTKAFAGDTGTNNIDDYAWYGANSADTTHPVGTRKPNELGLYDMSGNVWERTWDWYQNSYPTGHLDDPLGPESGYVRVNRGGAWVSGPSYCAVSHRIWISPMGRGQYGGIRLVRR